MGGPRGSPEDRFWRFVDKRGECWEWTGARSATSPYGLFRVGASGSKMTGAHRFGYEIQVGPITNGLHVLHKCDNPICVRAEHLFLGTAKDNALDKVAKGRHPKTSRPQRGILNNSAILDEDLVLRIRQLYSLCHNQREVSRQTGVPFPTIWNVVNRKTWTHI